MKRKTGQNLWFWPVFVVDLPEIETDPHRLVETIPSEDRSGIGRR
jgi:hypothetical protein